MNRRQFITASTAAITAALAAGPTTTHAQSNEARDFYELSEYTFSSHEQIGAFHTYMETAAIPAYNRLEIQPIGVFETQQMSSSIWVLMRHTTLRSFNRATKKLFRDEQYLKDGAAFLDADPKNPAFTRVNTSLLKAFDGLRTLETPVKNDGRIVELRRYMSATVKKARKKIDMFNSGEVGIMQRAGMGPILFGEHLTGPDMPNLTYFLSYKDEDAKKQAWANFLKDPKWKEISTDPQYKDTVSDIVSINLRPTPYSQI